MCCKKKTLLQREHLVFYAESSLLRETEHVGKPFAKTRSNKNKIRNVCILCGLISISASVKVIHS